MFMETTPVPENDKKKMPASQKKMARVELAMQFSPKKVILWFLILLLFVPFLVSLFKGNDSNKISLSTLLSDAKQQKVQQIEIDGQTLTAKYKDGSLKISRKEETQNLTDVLRQADIDLTSLDVSVKEQVPGRILLDILGTFLPVVLMAVFFLFLFRQARGAQDGIM